MKVCIGIGFFFETLLKNLDLCTNKMSLNITRGDISRAGIIN